MFILWKFKKSIFPQKIQKSLCITTKTYTQIQNFKLSRKRQRFRIYRKNKKCSIFYELFEYQQKWQLFFRPNWFFKSFFETFLKNLLDSNTIDSKTNPIFRIFQIIELSVNLSDSIRNQLVDKFQVGKTDRKSVV